MKLLERNLQTVWYCQYVGKTPIVDSDGYETGEYTVTYTDPVSVEVNVSPATGTAQMMMFGTLIAYDKVMVTADLECPINENSVLFVEKEPEFDEYGKPMYDYTVKRVAKSLNYISYALREAKVS